ncbi:MAG: ABC transporter substrate-binding protein [Myxococcota bacterium]|nr:ABC transporter substrate-binding protein [Myxococcota bacterium]
MKKFTAILITALLASPGCKPPPKKAVVQETTTGKPYTVFKYARSSAHKSLDPMRQFDGASGDIIQNLYDGLLQYNYLKRPYELEPNIAAKMPEPSADGLSYTWTIRDDVFFIDNACFPDGKGRKVTVDDVIYSIKRFADANVNTTSYPVLLKGVIAGLDEFRKKTRENKTLDYDAETVSGLKKVDERTFVMTLTKKNPLALMPFAVSALAIVPREAVKKYGPDFQHNPVGTGPYRMDKYERRGVMVLKKNERYHGRYPSSGSDEDKANGLLEDAGKKVPFIDEIQLPLVEESQPRMIKFKKGLLDWVALDKTNFTKMAVNDAQGIRLKPEFAKKYRFYSAKGLDASYFQFNMKDPVVGQNKALRQAFAHALNIPEYIDRMRNGRGVKLRSVVPHEIFGSEKDSGATGHDFNLEKAKKRLADAGFPEGKGLQPLVIELPGTNKAIRDVGEYFRIALAKAGIKAEMSYQDFSSYLKKVDAANFQIAYGSWAADYPDSENFFQLLYGPNKAPGPNHGSYTNPEFDKLYEEMRFMNNGPERLAVIRKMVTILDEDAPFALVANSIRFGLYQPWVKNLKRNLMADFPIKYFRIERSAPAKE